MWSAVCRGSCVRSIRSMVLRQGLGVVGAVSAAGLARLMTSMLFHVQPLDPVVLLGAITLLTGVATAASLLPAYQATAVEPKTVFE
jgi:hypothetical protein